MNLQMLLVVVGIEQQLFVYGILYLVFSIWVNRSIYFSFQIRKISFLQNLICFNCLFWTKEMINYWRKFTISIIDTTQLIPIISNVFHSYRLNTHLKIYSMWSVTFFLGLLCLKNTQDIIQIVKWLNNSGLNRQQI